MGLWSLEGKKILIIDDFAEMRTTLRGMLVSYGADDITMASNGEDAVDIICRRNFDIILCDYNLGDGKDGQQVLEEVKVRGKLPYSAVFIMVTAESSTFMVMGALEYQPDNYLSKPFTRSVLQSRIKKLLNKKSGLKKLSHALEQKNNSVAIGLCNEEIKNSPRYRLEFQKLKCELLISEHKYDEARKICNEVSAERNLPWARFNLGKIHYLHREYQIAKQLFEEIIKENATYISAYDWLAKTQQKLGEIEDAQSTIEMAIERSPKSVERQRTLGELAVENQDYKTCERARKKTIRMGKNSILRQAGDYAKLASVLVTNGDTKEALRMVDQLKYEFKGDLQAKLSAAVTKSKIYTEMGNETQSQLAIQEATKILSQNYFQLDNDLAIELTEALLLHGDTETANKVVTQLVTNDHDNQALLEKINQIYEKSGVEHNINDIVAGIRKEITAINNKGVKLLEAGKIDESIELFEQALERGPNNQVININSAQAYLMMVKSKGINDSLLEKTRICLDKTQDNENLQQRYKKLKTAYWEIINKNHAAGQA